MLEGDCNAPGTLIGAMLDIFKGVVYQWLVIYVNDNGMYARTPEEDTKHLKKVLQQLEEQKFFLQENNCQLINRK